MKGGSLKNIFKKVMHSKTLLYVLFGLAIVNLIGYLMQNNLAAIVLFLLIGFGSSHLTKNMIYVLLLAILVTNFIVRRGILKGLGFREGFVDGNDESDESDELHESSKTHETDDTEAFAGLGDADSSDSEDEVGAPVESKPKARNRVRRRAPRLLNINAANVNSENVTNMDDNHKKLMSAMDTMEPIIDRAEKMLEKLEGSKLGSMILGAGGGK